MCSEWCCTVGAKRCAEPCLRRCDITKAIVPTTRRITWSLHMSESTCFLTDRWTGRQGDRARVARAYAPKIPKYPT
jgi:hypothetical protein